MGEYLHDLLLENIKKRLMEIEDLLKNINSHWCYEDYIYRFYHQSFKVFGLQKTTEDIVKLLKSFAPEGISFNKIFKEIFKAGTGKNFEDSDNRDLTIITRPILEAFFHAKFFLEMSDKYGLKLDYPPDILPSGWAALLCLYNLR